MHAVYLPSSWSLYTPQYGLWSLPPNHHILLLTSGIATLSQISGKEHKDICRQLPSHLIRAMCALLNFVYFVKTLQCLKDCLACFHENKEVFVDLGVGEHLDLLKIHSLLPYCSSISLIGTTDYYNTEQSEHLHIDFTKDAYCSTNHKGK
ncbi:hypothetical protein H4582DRAFT_2112276 [Lactarius indigo]|nr:hypothetical protein H4582DRAFT_2112276 [Lactarius indigo]